MAQYKYSKDDYYRLTNAPCIDVALALGMEINERASDQKAWKMKDEQGLCIYREGNNWYRFSDGKHGFSIDLVIDKLGCSREQALDFIAKNVVNGVSEQVRLDHKAPANVKKELPKEKIFTVPAHDVKPSRVMAYLIKTRGIDPEIVKGMLQRKMIAEDSAHHNCLFFGRDEKGNIRSCAQRGTTQAQFRGEVSGGDKAYTFAMNGKSNVLRLFESPIDAMSHATFSKLLGKDWTADHRLSTNGCGSYESIKKYMENHPEISSVWFSFDNDEGGRNGAAASKEKLLHDFPDRQLKVHICYPTHGKDWNEDLQQFRQVEPEGMSVREYVSSDSNSYFSYHGFHFQPVGILPPGNTLSDIAQDISSIPEMGYNDEFSYADFIRANTTGKNADIFRCIESNQLCLPGENELYAYTGEYLSTFHVQTAQEEQPDDDECEMEIG